LVESILNAAASYLRSALARTISLRTVPQLHFVYDESIEYGQRLSRLIDEANPPTPEDNEED
jgi:ribosome-binding factor A